MSYSIFIQVYITHFDYFDDTVVIHVKIKEGVSEARISQSLPLYL